MEYVEYMEKGISLSIYIYIEYMEYMEESSDIMREVWKV